jgi:hypothetical protein
VLPASTVDCRFHCMSRSRPCAQVRCDCRHLSGHRLCRAGTVGSRRSCEGCVPLHRYPRPTAQPRTRVVVVPLVPTGLTHPTGRRPDRRQPSREACRSVSGEGPGVGGTRHSDTKRPRTVKIEDLRGIDPRPRVAGPARCFGPTRLDAGYPVVRRPVAEGRLYCIMPRILPGA